MHYGFRFGIAVLAVWRLTHIVAVEDGPWHVFRRLRQAAGNRIGGRLISCFNCLSVWIALPFAWFVADMALERVVVWWAISGAAVLLERATRAPFEIEVREDPDELLRRDERRALGHHAGRP